MEFLWKNKDKTNLDFLHLKNSITCLIRYRLSMVFKETRVFKDLKNWNENLLFYFYSKNDFNCFNFISKKLERNFWHILTSRFDLLVFYQLSSLKSMCIHLMVKFSVYFFLMKKYLQTFFKLCWICSLF